MSVKKNSFMDDSPKTMLQVVVKKEFAEKIRNLSFELGFVGSDFTEYLLVLGLRSLNSYEPENQPQTKDEAKSVDESVHHPDHYNGRECMDMLIKMGVGEKGCVFNIVKYLWRWEKKDGLRDLNKARWYLNELINLMENK